MPGQRDHTGEHDQTEQRQRPHQSGRIDDHGSEEAEEDHIVVGGQGGQIAVSQRAGEPEHVRAVVLQAGPVEV
ncbi:MAG TPA: hypothetical protein VHH53_14940, partial [Pseudonocardiaceae bacterium]|nr:hypothetical protein [Pseudonocardiaceae bacterium]